MLAGWEGKGLGKHAEGITKPITYAKKLDRKGLGMSIDIKEVESEKQNPFEFYRQKTKKEILKKHKLENEKRKKILSYLNS
ncbi:hypothetical protein O9G_002213 [Rozella allomycis CSF55]|uniref:G-patch domain-containing protein n=1 Tax=Rozella allomycis (strain CSF55) TaxID=988480 RepID=A0A075AQ85_ROZAC|nr:hypothetical protein O9G_002213 [Rozella allomycis CSF55]|eukprot:EPZ32373.1 hypothetical protein O9G_002213 [Rozella allomycis CSF55]